MATNIYYLTYTIPLILLFGVLRGIYSYKTLNKNAKILLFYLILSLAIDITSRIIVSTTRYNNLILFDLLSIVEMLIFSLFYLNFAKQKNIILILATIGVSYALIEIFLIDPIHAATFESYSKIVAAFLIIIMALKYISNQIKQEREIFKYNLHLVIISFFSLEFIFLLPLNFLINYTSLTVFYIWLIRLIVNLLFYTYLIYFIWMNGKNLRRLHYGL